VIAYNRGVVVGTERKTADERRHAVLDAAFEEFAIRGLHGASTETVAQRAGISQPYVFRLFGTKKELFKAVISRCFRQTLELFQRAAEGKRGEEALQAMGNAYVNEMLPDATRLRAQMQAYAACEDAEIREVVRNGYGDLVAYAERVSDLPP
jgi:AcrR family transcriptional regulator